MSVGQLGSLDSFRLSVARSKGFSNPNIHVGASADRPSVMESFVILALCRGAKNNSIKLADPYMPSINTQSEPNLSTRSLSEVERLHGLRHELTVQYLDSEHGRPGALLTMERKAMANRSRDPKGLKGNEIEFLRTYTKYLQDAIPR
jgi:protein-tyrosine-phosphatase